MCVATEELEQDDELLRRGGDDDEVRLIDGDIYVYRYDKSDIFLVFDLI